MAVIVSKMATFFAELTRFSESFKVEEFLDTVEYDYPKFHLSMDCFICSVVFGDLVLKEHEAARWLTKDTLDSVDWLPADLGLIEKIREYLN
jgi:8-oxo-dGTP diphosphatase